MLAPASGRDAFARSPAAVSGTPKGAPKRAMVITIETAPVRRLWADQPAAASQCGSDPPKAMRGSTLMLTRSVKAASRAA
jgi:hypothetical protein